MLEDSTILSLIITLIILHTLLKKLKIPNAQNHRDMLNPIEFEKIL